MGERVEWGDLPKELWPAIGKRLDSSIDVLRFRSICKSWRSSITPSPRFHRLVESPFGKQSLAQNTIYRLELPDDAQNPSMSSSKGWLIKVEESNFGQMRLLNPLTNTPKRYPSDTPLNLMNFRVFELIKAYTTLEHDIGKVVLFPTDVEDCMVFTLYHGRLRFSNFGDEGGGLVDNKNFDYDDIIVHNGQFYVVDKWGTISWVDSSSLKLVQFFPTLCGLGHKKHLVESGGSLYVVDMYIKTEPNNWNVFMEVKPTQRVTDIKVYKLDEEWGTWMDVKDLGGHMFVLGKDSNISLSAQEFCGCEENCIYFSNNGDSFMFSLESSKFKPPKVFWPSPTFFDLKFSLSG